jgi:hypothetical protein
MLIHRSKHSLSRPFGSKLYHFARRSIVLYHMQSSCSISPLFCGIEGISPPDENDEDRLFSLMAMLPKMQNFIYNYVYGDIRDHESDLQEVLSEAKALEARLQDWENGLPPTWTYKTAQNLYSSHCAALETRYVPEKVHRYQDVYSARLWNLYRTSRIILFSVTISLSTLPALDSPSLQPTLGLDTAQAMIREYVDDICASVSYLSGKAFSLTRSNESDLDGRSKPHTSQSQNQNGRYSLLWPLYVASSVTFVPQSQRSWMRQQIVSIGEAWEPLAKWLASSQSQILIHRPEDFAFDCV